MTPTNTAPLRHFLILTLLYTIWASLFIHNTSFEIFSTRYYCLFDDAMISMRYAENWVQGKGLVWNEGERVEGYTNPLQVCLMALCLLTAPKIQAVLLVQLAGALTVIASAWMAGKTFRNLGGNPNQTWLVWGGIYLLYPLSYWAILGMETGLVTALLLGALAYSTKPNHTPSGWVLGLLLCLLYFARPDACLYGLCLIAYLLWTKNNTHRHPQTASLALILLIVTISAHILWRVSYYGELQPNTATLKVSGWDPVARLSNGIAYVQPYIPQALPLLMLSSIALLTLPRKQAALLAALIATPLAYTCLVGGDAWGYWRFLTPATTLLVILATLGANRLFNTQRLIPHAALATSFALGLSLYWFGSAYLREQILVEKALEVESHQHWVKQGLLLKELLPKDARLAVTSAGALPFFAERPGIDILGRVDKTIAREPRRPFPTPWNTYEGRTRNYQMASWPGHDKYNLTYSLEEKLPDFLERTHWGQDSLRPEILNLYKVLEVEGLQLLIKKTAAKDKMPPPEKYPCKQEKK